MCTLNQINTELFSACLVEFCLEVRSGRNQLLYVITKLPASFLLFCLTSFKVWFLCPTSSELSLLFHAASDGKLA